MSCDIDSDSFHGTKKGNHVSMLEKLLKNQNNYVKVQSYRPIQKNNGSI